MSPSRGSTITALSGISGSISIACWVVVFSPQIIENFRRSSAEGLSVTFIVIWLLGDVFNILGAVLQGVLPTMIILAVYYTLADIVLLGQVWWYKGFTMWDSNGVEENAIRDGEDGEDTLDERSSLLPGVPTPQRSPTRRPRIGDLDRASRSSISTIGSRMSGGVDGTHLSPATPFLPPPNATVTPPAAETLKPQSALRSAVVNLTSLIVVCGIGVLGWWVSVRSTKSFSHHGHHPITDPGEEPIQTEVQDVRFDLWGQIFGYLCAVLYLGSRVPQILLNFRRKSTEGVSMLFFLFACVGNLAYVLSILLYEPPCMGFEAAGLFTQTASCVDDEWGKEYGKYFLVNLSWLIGSAGTLLLDFMIFVQFFLYRAKAPETTG